MLPAYERDPFCTELETRILEVGTEAGRPYALLEDTLFYPEGGGQPSDQGWLNNLAVVAVQKQAGAIRHYLEAPLETGPAALRLDWDRRFDHMQQHTGQHLLTAVAQDRFHWSTTAFHLGPRVCDIEVDAPALTAGDLARLEEAVAAEIRACRTVAARWVDADRYGSESVRSRGLPEGHVGDIRLVEIEGLDLNTCGGTHLRHTGQLEALKLLGTEGIRGGTRLFFVAGGRVRSRLAAHEARNAQLRARLGAPDEDLVAALEIKLEQLVGLERRSRRLEEALGTMQAAALAAAPGFLAEAHFDDRDMAALQRLARQVLSEAPGKVVFLTATQGAQGLFLLSAGDGTSVDLPKAGQAVMAALGAKGGGAGRTVQGKAPDLSGRGAALDVLRGMGD